MRDISEGSSTESRAVCGIMLKNVIDPDKPQAIILYNAVQKKKRFACWIAKARIQTHTHNV
jgi:hypothetical protein